LCDSLIRETGCAFNKDQLGIVWEDKKKLEKEKLERLNSITPDYQREQQIAILFVECTLAREYVERAKALLW
jgi:uncharacterized protein YcbK (DUF882 family)